MAEQLLRDAGRANDLDADGVLGPGDGVGHRTGPLGARVVDHRLGYFEELRLRTAADLLDEIRPVAREVPLHVLKYAVGLLQGRVALLAGRRECLYQRIAVL